MASASERSAEEEWSDDGLWDAFVSATLRHAEWTHRAHVRIGFLHVRRLGFEAALAVVRTRIQSLNAAHGTPESPTRGYHETITVAFLRLIAAAVVGLPPDVDSTSFCEQHPELLDKRVLTRFYTPDRLMSPEAKRAFLPPNIAPLPE